MEWFAQNGAEFGWIVVGYGTFAVPVLRKGRAAYGFAGAKTPKGNPLFGYVRRLGGMVAHMIELARRCHLAS
jgi:hypothetical protein